MSANQSNNTPQSAQSSAGGANKTTGKMNVYVIAGIMLFVIFVLFIALGGAKEDPKSKPKDTQKVESLEGSGKQGIQKSTRVYEERKPSDLSYEQNQATNTAATDDLQIFRDPTTNLDMVKTPSGLLPVNSKEGRKYIEDFRALQAASGTGVNAQGKPTQAIAGVTKDDLAASVNQSNEQVKALDQKLNDAHQRIDELLQVVKKQNETVEKMSEQIKTVQPIVKSPRELAKEIFGKNGERVLKDRNNRITASSIVGDKAYIYDADGDLHLVGVGDIVPGTSVKIKAINQVEREVVVAD